MTQDSDKSTCAKQPQSHKPSKLPSAKVSMCPLFETAPVGLERSRSLEHIRETEGRVCRCVLLHMWETPMLSFKLAGTFEIQFWRR